MLLMGATLGAGGKAVVEGLVSTASADPLTPFVHAVDLRRSFNADEPLKVTAYGDAIKTDGGHRDIGPGACHPSATTLTAAQALMGVMSKECSWEEP